MIRRASIATVVAVGLIQPCVAQPARPQLSGIYPHLAVYNQEGECGIGAVVPWADRLWVVTYAPHKPMGSSDKLYEITKQLQQIVRPESVGGTPANRMVHRESGQLFLGPYAIDAERNVRVIPYAQMPGRPTGNARHLEVPADKILFATMEEGCYEVDVRTLAVTELWQDQQPYVRTQANGRKPGRKCRLPGYHGKGFYSGQGVYVYSNNGEFSKEARRRPDIPSGALGEWDGKADRWTLVRRNQFTEVTGPDGIEGSADPATAPIWSVGWDHRSLLLGVRSAKSVDGEHWRFFRLPKSSHAYDGAHGWNTEWPRIRDIGEDQLLMTMHGAFWRFPRGFGVGSWSGLAPRSNYLKVVGDFCRWGDHVVLGCDDIAKNEFLNKRRAKGEIAASQSHSNLWFLDPMQLDRLGPVLGRGAVFFDEDVDQTVSDPFLFAGYDLKGVHVAHRSDEPARVSLSFGDGDEWEPFRVQVNVPANGYRFVSLSKVSDASWVRVATSGKVRGLTVAFCYRNRDGRRDQIGARFTGLARAHAPMTGGLLRARGGDERTLSLLAMDDDGSELGYYELGADLQLRAIDDEAARRFTRERAKIPSGVLTVDEASVVFVDDKGRRWRLPKGSDAYDAHPFGSYRVDREVVTERDLFHAHGTFFELPSPNAGGFAKIRAVATSDRLVHDYCGYRGLLVISGVADDAPRYNRHVLRSDDGKAAVWAGAIDDLWELGKPRGHGGPWLQTKVRAWQRSDPYLMTGYDQKVLTLAADRRCAITVEVDITGDGTWCAWRTFVVEAGTRVERQLPAEFSAYWVRFAASADCTATAQLQYR